MDGRMSLSVLIRHGVPGCNQGGGILWRASGKIGDGEQDGTDDGGNGRYECWTELGLLEETCCSEAERRARSEPSLVTSCTNPCWERSEGGNC